MLTIENYRKLNENEVSYPCNGQGDKLPQLIDDLWEAREALLTARRMLIHSHQTENHYVEEAIARLNRSLPQLGISL